MTCKPIYPLQSSQELDFMVVISRIRLKRRGLESLLSPLEADILKILWAEKRLRVREIYERLKSKRKVAHTSIAVILDRLHKKKFVTRNVEVGLGGNHYIYSIKITRTDFENSVIKKTVDNLMENFGDVAINYFCERFSKKKIDN